MKYILIATIICLFLSINVTADTFDKVVTIFNNSCAFSTCHDNENPIAGLDLSGDKNAIYEQLINKPSKNEAATAKKHPLVKPGDPARSFLYRKVNNDLHNDSKLTEGELENMPTGGALLKQEIELIRQWILFGAKNDDKEYIDVDLLEEYYTVGGLEQIAAPAAPAPDEGYQLQLGPIFLAPGEEVEYIYRYELQNDESVEVNRVDVAMNEQSHHFLFFKFDEGSENDQDDGLTPIDFFTNMAISNNTKMIGGWAYSRDFTLPEGTAMKWKKNEVLKFNYHILNYSSSEILPAKVYINVYTQPVGTALMEMHSEFHLSLEDDRYVGFEFPPGESIHQWTMRNFDEADRNQPVHIWLLGSHTHKFGVDFDMYLYENGQVGDQIYEGFHNFDHSIPQDFYDFGEPPFRIFDDYLTLEEDDALFIEGKYNNTSNERVTFGLTTQDEMFGIFVNYLVGDISQLPVSVELEPLNPETTWAVYPNPASDFIQIDLPQINDHFQLSMYDSTGRLVYDKLINGKSNLKSYTLKLNEYKEGFYFIRIITEDFIDTKKLAIQ